MKKQFLGLALLTTMGIFCLSSCLHYSTGDSQDMAEESFDDFFDEGNNSDERLPRYLRNSEKWGDVVSNRMEAKKIESIDFTGFSDIEYEQSDSIYFIVKGNEKVLEMYDVKVNAEGKLTVRTKDKLRNRKYPNIRVYVFSPYLKGVKIMGAGDLKIKKPVEFENDFSLSIHGAGDADIEDLACEALRVDIQGAGDLEMFKMKATSFDFVMEGAGDAHIREGKVQGDAAVVVIGAGEAKMAFDCANLDVQSDGAGEIDMTTNCKGTIIAKSVGVGGIELKGTAKKLVKQKAGLAHIDSKKLEVSDVDLLN
ncbi:MAG: DUF2807 domain-containing protein [Bacteroidaceae bacterium]|nr:DUF2807 domain-containing protein [Bacteroidaceae bacterium]